MKVSYHPTLANPGERIEIDSADWHLTPKRPQPVSGEVIDQQSGWVHEVCIQGMSSTGDHHVVRHLGDDCELISWTDDPEDDAGSSLYDPSEPREWWFHAQEIMFRPLAPDPDLGGAINTNITRTIYGGKRFIEDWDRRIGPVKNTILKPWEDFVPPPEDITRHGIWVSDALEELHKAARSPIGWRNWGDHLDPSELDPITGLVLPQYSQGRMSPPRGTLTQFLRDTARATGVHVSGNEVTMEAGAGASETLVSPTLAASTDNLAFCFTSDTTFPNVADWPNGLYECQTECSSIDTNVTYGLLTLGGSAGHFAVVDSGLTADQETWVQTQSAFGSAGLNLASQTIDPAVGVSSDRFECLIAGARSAGCHGNRTFTLLFDADAFGRGPWAAAGGGPRGPLGHPLHGALGGPIGA